MRTVTIEKRVPNRVSAAGPDGPTATSASAIAATREDPPVDGERSGGWPAGVSAYTTVIGSFTELEGARRRAAEAGGAGILRSDDYLGLTPGYWVVFVGRHSTNDAATQATDVWRRRGFGDAYNRYVQQP